MNLRFVQKSCGLDIGQRALRLIQLKKGRGLPTIISSGEIKVPDGVIKNGKIEKIDEFVSLVKKLLKKVRGKKISTKYVNACLPGPNTFIVLIKLTYPESKNILEEILNEAKKHIPYPLENTYLDWQYVDEKDKSKVLISICPKDIVDNYQQALAKAGLIATALEIEVATICRSLIEMNERQEEPIMIMDLGATRTSVTAYQNQTILFSISLSFSSDNLTNELEKKLNLSHAEAKKAKKTCGLDLKKAGGGVRKILEPLVDNLATQIREARYFYHEHFFKDKQINNLLLTGGGSNLIGLAEFLSEKSRITVKLADPAVNINKANQALLESDIQSYTTAIGLALRKNSVQ